MNSITNTIERTVDESMTAKEAGSGTLPVFATPEMIALIEETCFKSIEHILNEGETSVGIKVDVEHLKPTPVGMKVRCESELISGENRKFTFDVKVYDEEGLIGKGTHERFAVDIEKFMKKAGAN